MKLHTYIVRLLCGTQGLYERTIEIAHAPENDSEAFRLLIQCFSSQGLNKNAIGLTSVLMSYPREDRNRAIIATSISGAPAVALVMREGY